MRKYLIVLLLLLCTGVVAACGSSSKPSRATSHNLSLPTPGHCPPGQSTMGCSVPHQLGINFHLVKLPPNQGLIPDLYEGNSTFNLAQLRSHVVGVIIKAWEFREDHKFVARWQALKAAHIWHDAYIFLRSCSEVRPFIQAVNAVGGFHQAYTGPPIIDAEVSGAGPALPCAVRTVESMTGELPVEYTSPGTNPSSFHAPYEWAAAYGNYTHSPCIWTCSPVAWQYTDGQFGPFPHALPGVASGDLSVNYGITRLVYKPPKPKYPVCYQHRVPKATCSIIKKRVVGFAKAENTIWLKTLAPNHCLRHRHRPVCAVARKEYNADWTKAWNLRKSN